MIKGIQHFNLGGREPGCFTSCFGLCKCVLERGAFTDAPKGSWWDRECEGLSCSIYLSIHPSIHQPHRHTHKNTGTSPSHAVQICYKTGWYLLDLLGVFVADKDNNWINVNTVEPLNGVRGDVEQTVTALHQKDKNNGNHRRPFSPSAILPFIVHCQRSKSHSCDSLSWPNADSRFILSDKIWRERKAQNNTLSVISFIEATVVTSKCPLLRL